MNGRENPNPDKAACDNSEKNVPGKDAKENNHKREPSLWFFVILLFVVVSLFIGVELYLGQAGKITVNPSYLALGLIGVVFHLMSLYREKREEEGFQWKKYRFDYLFRALQVCVYIIVIDNLLQEDNSKLSGNMALISLLVGMFIRKVEEAFENLGERLGDMLKGFLGPFVQQLTPSERRKKTEELQNQFLALKKAYGKLKGKLPEASRKDLEERLMKCKELIQRGKLDSAEIKLLDTDFRMKDLSEK